VSPHPGGSRASRRSLLPVLAGAVALSGTLFPARPAGAAVPPEWSPALTRAAEAYEAGRCADVLAAFGTLPADAAVSLDGVSLYRWGSAPATPGAATPSTSTAARGEAAARDRLAGRTARRLLLPRQRAPEPRPEAGCRGGARLAVERYQAGALTVPQDDAAAWFRLGKLYTDAATRRGR